jgi:hypothetical protein
MRVVLSDVLHGAVDLAIEIVANDDTAELRFQIVSTARPGDFWHREDRHLLRFEIRPDLRFLVDGHEAPWNFYATDDGPLAAAVEWALERVDPNVDFFDEEALARNESLFRVLDRACRCVADLAIVRCDASVRERVLDLAPEVRVFAYRTLVTSPATAQLLEQCPGAFTLAAGLGVTLARPTETTIADLFATMQRVPSDASAILERAPAQLAPGILLECIHAEGRRPSDIPHDQCDRVMWFEWVGVAARITRSTGVVGLVHLASFHALALERIAHDRGSDRTSLMIEIAMWAESTEMALDEVTPEDIRLGLDEQWVETFPMPAPAAHSAR